jgi:hypothetical protein
VTLKDDAAVIGLAKIVDRCVDVGDTTHASAMVGFYFGARCEQIAPDFAVALRDAFDRSFATSSGLPAEFIEAQFRTAIEQMAEAWRGVDRP